MRILLVEGIEGQNDGIYLTGKITEPLIRLLPRIQTVKREECLSLSEISCHRHDNTRYTHDQSPLGPAVLAMISPPLLFPPHS